jgi:hypothetical protein
MLAVIEAPGREQEDIRVDNWLRTQRICAAQWQAVRLVPGQDSRIVARSLETGLA